MKINFKKIQILLAAITLSFVSCSKQEAPSIDTGEIRTQKEIDRLEACSLVNFNKGVLLYHNTLLMFRCNQWDLEFPKMYEAIKRVQSSSWDHFMGPIDKEFVENLARRDRFFNNIKELDSKGGLDDLSRVLVALNETNFFDSVKAMFSCVENPYEEACKERNPNIPNKESLLNIIKLVDTKPKTIAKGSEFVKSLNVAIGPNAEKLRQEINRFKNDPIYIEFRLKLIDALSRKAQKGLTKDDREFLSTILLTGNADGSAPWIYSWIHDMKMNRDKFRDLVEYPILVNPAFVGEIKGLKIAYDEGFSCSLKSTADANDLIEFDFRSHLGSYVEIIKHKDYKTFYDNNAAHIVGMKMSSEVCKELETNKYRVDFIKMLSNIANFLGEKKFYDLVKFVVSHTTAKGDVDQSFAENLYLFDMVASDIFSNATILNGNIISKTREFYPVIFDVIHSLPPEAFVNLGEVLQDFLLQENDLKFKGVADFWNFFNATEKNFVFNFVDRHFEDDTQYVLLFDFYTRFLDDLRDVQPIFKESWMGTAQKEEMSYLTLQDFFYQFAGKDTLLDFKKFFGRDQILRVLQVISNGNNTNAMAIADLNYLKSDDYVTRVRGDHYVFAVSYKPNVDADYDARPVVECMQKFAEIENGFYELVRRLPEACAKVKESNIAFRAFNWMNSINETYKEFNPGNKNTDNNLLSERGLLSPYMLNTSIGLIKIIDNLLGDINSVVPTKNGINYLMDSAKYHVYDKKAGALVDKNLEWLEKWFNVKPEENLIHRNAMLRAFSTEENFSLANNVSKNVAGVLIKYSDWVKEGKAEVLAKKNAPVYDPNQACEKVINQFVTAYPCPNKEVVKKHTNSIVKLLANTWEKEQGSPIASLLKSVKPGEGIDIPLNGKKTSKYRLTLKETVKYLYDTSDKNFDVNRTKTYYVNAQGKSSNEVLTTLERVETVIRDVRFDNNYLGVAFLNAVTHAEDYNDEVDNRKKLLQKCIKIPGIRCAKPMSDDDLRLAKNALETFDSLSDVNNGRGLDKRLNYGTFLKTFEQTLVQSSAKEAQEVQLLPLKEEVLLKHNGKILGDMTGMTSWSNLARVIRDRVGRTRQDFDKFINSREFNRVDKSLLYGFDLPQAGPSAERLLKKIQVVPSGEKQNTLDNTIDWLASLNYEQTRLVEETVSRLLVVGSYLGTPEVVFGVNSEVSNYERFKDNNLLQIFLALEKLVDHYPMMKNYFPQEMKLIDAFKPVNNALIFLTDLLGSTNDPEKNIAYLALNDLFVVAQKALFDDLADPRIASFNSKTVNGMDLVTGFLQNSKNVESTYYLINTDYRYLDTLHENKGAWFRALGQNVIRIADAKKVDLTPVRDYVNFTTKTQVCLSGSKNCMDNYHFDEVTNLIKFLGKPSVKNSKETNFMLASRKVLVENFDQLNSMLEELMTALKIKSVKPPLSIN